MANELDPIVGNWYQHLDKGQSFFVVAIEPRSNLVEIQYFNGDLDELDRDQWRDLDIDLAEAPENWSGAMDIAEQDDYGTEITDTSAADWHEPLQEIKLQPSDTDGELNDPLGEGFPEEEPIDGEV